MKTESKSLQLARVRDLFVLWLSRIRLENDCDYFDINKEAEDIAGRLLNLVLDLDLRNLNREQRRNFPGMDLADKKKGIAVQVTSERSSSKIKHCLKLFSDHQLHRDYPQGPRFLILHLVEPKFDQNTKKQWAVCDQNFNPDEHIWTKTTLVNQIADLFDNDPDRFQAVMDLLEAEFGDKKSKNGLPGALYVGSKTWHEDLTRRGRFRGLHIRDILLLPWQLGKQTAPEKRWLDAGVRLESGSGEKWEKAATALRQLWSRPCPHAVLVGPGGMGKTVSLIRLWEEFTREPRYIPGKPLPVFIQLNEINHREKDSREPGFIVDQLNRYYLHHREQNLSEKELVNLGKYPEEEKNGEQPMPRLILLLDGFNEITVEKTGLLLELKRLEEQCLGIQMVITSRYDMRGNFNWGHWNLLRLEVLEKEKVAGYLQGQGLAVPAPGRLLDLLGNPMMLTLYAATCQVQENHQDSRYCSFKRAVDAPGELLWNFIEAQAAGLPERVGPDEARVVYYWYLIKYLLPGLGYEMAKQGLFAFTNTQFQESLDRLCQRFARGDFLTASPLIGKYVRLLPLGECGHDMDRHERAARVRDIFCNELHMLVEEGQTLRFLHQDFRDFFAARHVLNEADISLSREETPDVFKQGLLDYFVRRLVGEIEGEHRVKPYLSGNAGWNIDIPTHNRLHRILDLCRGKFGAAVGNTVWNIVMIWIEVRGELSGADLSGLDLSRIPLNGVWCSRFYEDKYLAAVFTGARVHEKNLLPQGHSGLVKSAVYSSDGKKILSASYDSTIKEWDAGTGECVKTMTGHTHIVESAVYSPDGKKILSASADRTIKEWDAGTGQCVKTMADNTNGLKTVMYSPDGEKIISASDYGPIKEWDVVTGKFLKVLHGHWGEVNSALYSPYGKKILSASVDGTIKEWDTVTGECLKNLAGHEADVTIAVYNPDGKKILSASWDKTIKEWDAGTGECVKTMAGHMGIVKSAVYSPDGKKILSVSDDLTIKEWDAGTGQCVKTMAGHTHCITSAVYSPDGKKIISASYGGTIKEWDAGTGECVKTMAGHIDDVKSAVYSPDGKKIISASYDGSIKEWDAGTGECVKIMAAHTGKVNSLVYSPDGKKILSASNDGTIKEWDAESGQCVKTMVGHMGDVISAVYSPDGKKILSYFFDTIKEWDTGTCQCVKTIPRHLLGNGHGSYIQNAMYSPDGKIVLSTFIIERDADTGKYLKIHNKSDNPQIPGYPPKENSTELNIRYNTIYVPSTPGQEKRELINIPGLFIQGCSFENLEKGSEWSPKGLAILKQYHARV